MFNILKKYGKHKPKTEWGGGLRSQSLYDQIIATQNLFVAWYAFREGKTRKADVIAFSKNYVLEISLLRSELSHGQYAHGSYSTFYIQDPKLRKINKPTVRDRIVHHALFAKLYWLFDVTFIFDSYSCRARKGTHRAIRRLHEFFRKESANNTKNCWVLKCDVRKFFYSIDQDVLMGLIDKKIKDQETWWLISVIIKSFTKGLPLGNITSQLFANIYLNELDQFIKHKLRVKYYIRYCDDFVILHKDKKYLEALVPTISDFLTNHLKLSLHPNKIIIRKYRQGIDFLGYISFPTHTILRVKTKRRMFKKIREKLRLLKTGEISKEYFEQMLKSYLGMLSHCKAHSIKNELVVLLRNSGL